MRKGYYKNETWEPFFEDISPVLAKLYFATNSGLLRSMVARAIFKKLSIMERIAVILDED